MSAHPLVLGLFSLSVSHIGLSITPPSSIFKCHPVIHGIVTYTTNEYSLIVQVGGMSLTFPLNSISSSQHIQVF
jgi:hypothetical protein